MPLRRCTIALLMLVSVAPNVALSAEAAIGTRDAITQYGITWTFAARVPAGRFVTGDWWVVGPATVRSVSPAPTADRHGSAVNPPAGSTQGYDGRIAGFDASLRARFPLELKPGDSLVSTASVDAIGDRTPDTVRRQYCRGPLRTAVVLTCLKEAPPADAFRPAYVGTWKQPFAASQLRRDILPGLKAPATLPDLKGYERDLERIWLDHMRQWVNRKMHPLENMPDYGREITNIVSDVALLLLLADPEKQRETLLLRYVQKGIDYYGVVRSDNNLWIANGGHNSGRKWPILFAGLVLGHEGMMRVQATFQEDQQTYYGKGFLGQKALWTIAPRNPNRCHEEADPKTWKTFGDTKGNNGLKAEGYRKLNGPTWVGQALAARLTGMVPHWNHPAFFDYVDRWWRETQSANAFVKAMWTTYRAKADAIGADVQKKRSAPKAGRRMRDGQPDGTCPRDSAPRGYASGRGPRPMGRDRTSGLDGAHVDGPRLLPGAGVVLPCRSPCDAPSILSEARPPTGEPCAGEPHARFGGGRGWVHNQPFLPLSAWPAWCRPPASWAPCSGSTSRSGSPS